MLFLLNLFPHSLGVLATAAGSNTLSDAEEFARYPVLVVTGLTLLSLGVVCDLFLLFRLKHSLSSRVEPATDGLLHIEPKPWGLDDVLFALGLLVLLWVVLGGATSLVFKLAHIDYDQALPWFLSMEMILHIISLLGFALFFRRHGIDWRQAIGLQRKSPGEALAIGGISFLAVLPPLAIVFAVSAKLCRVLGIDDTPQPIADLLENSGTTVVMLIIVLALVVAPAFEEFFFRGFAYPALKQRWGVGWALVIVSAAFASIHLHLPSWGPLFALALGLGLSYEFTGSLLVPITMHALFNATNVGMVLYVRAHS